MHFPTISLATKEVLPLRAKGVVPSCQSSSEAWPNVITRSTQARAILTEELLRCCDVQPFRSTESRCVSYPGSGLQIGIATRSREPSMGLVHGESTLLWTTVDVSIPSAISR